MDDGSPKQATDFQYCSTMAPFMKEVMRTVAEQNDFRGIGGHGVQDHGGHGPHRQTSIGLGGNMTVNFREEVK